MTPPRSSLCLSALLAASCASWSSRGPAAAEGLLGSVATDPEAYGQLVYRGDVYPLGEAASVPLFRYERRVARQGALQRSTSFTRREAEVVLVEVADHGAEGDLRSYAQYQLQTGEVGRVEVEGRRVRLRFADAAGEREATEEVDAPVVVGPTLFTVVEAHRATLAAGNPVPIRFAVPARLETVGFELQQVPAAPGETRIRMRATSPLIALAVAPLSITYREGRLVRLEGRIPTRRKVPGGWADLDARVEYRDLADRYQ
jgi:hypothetical protein